MHLSIGHDQLQAENKLRLMAAAPSRSSEPWFAHVNPILTACSVLQDRGAKPLVRIKYVCICSVGQYGLVFELVWLQLDSAVREGIVPKGSMGEPCKRESRDAGRADQKVKPHGERGRLRSNLSKSCKPAAREQQATAEKVSCRRSEKCALLGASVDPGRGASAKSA